MQRKHWFRLLPVLLLFLASCRSDAIPSQNVSKSPEPKRTIQSVQSGDRTGEFIVQGQSRTYLVHIPKAYQKNKQLPLVLAFHGYGSQGKDLARGSGLNQLADREGFIVVYPDGLDRRWNLSGMSFETDDVTFTHALLEHLTQNYSIDSRKIYAVGISNGGFLVQQLACVSHQRSPSIAAFASIAATLPQPLQENCRPPAPVPMLMINGTADQKVPWQGGQRPYGTILSVPDSIRFWQQQNGCNAKTPIEQHPTPQVDIARYSNCQAGGEVELVTLKGAGHVFPRGGGGKMSLIDGSREVWQFFQRHPS